MSQDARSWSFPLSFWTANVIEAAERAAYYGWFIMLAPFLTSVVGYSDIEAGYIGGCFAALLYLLPFVSGAFADRGARPRPEPLDALASPSPSL